MAKKEHITPITKEDFAKAYKSFDYKNSRESDDVTLAKKTWGELLESMKTGDGLPFKRYLQINFVCEGEENRKETTSNFFSFMTLKNGFKVKNDKDNPVNKTGALLFFDTFIHQEHLMIYSKIKGKKAVLNDCFNNKKLEIDITDCAKDNIAVPDEKKAEYESIKEKYDEDIRPLLKEFASKSTEELNLIICKDYKGNVKEINDLREKYKNFSGKIIFNAIAVMRSVCGEPGFNMTRICADKYILKLADILGVKKDDESEILNINQAVLEKAIEYSGVDASKMNDGDKETFYDRLNSFLWKLVSKPSDVFDSFTYSNVIFSGAPGTGKTHTVSTAIEYLKWINPEKYRDRKMIQFHPSYTYQDFIEGIKPVGFENGSLKLDIVNGSFKDFCIYVRQQNEEYRKDHKVDRNDAKTFENWPHYYFVVDEINRGNLSNIFGETFTLLESDYRDYDFSGEDGVYDSAAKSTNSESALIETALSSTIASLDDDKQKKLVYKKVVTKDKEGNIIRSEVKFGIPFNIHFIGMMNDVDRSIDSFDLAFRRRFRWEPVSCDYDVIYDVLNEKYGGREDDTKSVENFVKSCMALNYYITGEQINNKELDKTTKSYSSEVKVSDTCSCGKLYEIGHGMFLNVTKLTKTNYITNGNKGELFDNYLAGTLKEYLRQQGNTESELEERINTARKYFTGTFQTQNG